MPRPSRHPLKAVLTYFRTAPIAELEIARMLVLDTVRDRYREYRNRPDHGDLVTVPDEPDTDQPHTTLRPRRSRRQKEAPDADRQ
jgi:hypothetical protein